jgi:hypothetical protein
MTLLSPLPPAFAKPLTGVDYLRRKPTRITTTLSWHLHQRLQQRADFEGRSLSNLVAHLLESASDEQQA